jgi:hypothetical protein
VATGASDEYLPFRGTCGETNPKEFTWSESEDGEELVAGPAGQEAVFSRFRPRTNTILLGTWHGGEERAIEKEYLFIQ